PNSLSSCGGTQDVHVELTNTGANTIPIGAASVNLKISGANNYTATAFNTTNILSGNSETITFSGIPITGQGQNLDTAWLELPGDGEPENDTLKTAQTILPSILSYPAK